MNKNSRTQRDKLLAAAEGYHELGMFDHALAELARIPDPEHAAFAVNYLRGEVLKDLERHEEALKSFRAALAEKPEDVSLLLSMAWCYKRTSQLAKAIAAAEQAYRVKPTAPIILYNLGCYWALVGNKTQALSWLGRAVRMDKSLRKLIPAEHDFDSIRNDPDFQLIARSDSETDLKA